MESLTAAKVAALEQKIIRKLPLRNNSRLLGMIICKVIYKSIQCVQSLWQEKKFVNRVGWGGNLLTASRWGRDGGKTLTKARLSLQAKTHEAFIIPRRTAIALRLTRAKMPSISQETTLRSQYLSIYFTWQISIQIPWQKLTGFQYSLQREWNCFVPTNLGISFI